MEDYSFIKTALDKLEDYKRFCIALVRIDTLPGGSVKDFKENLALLIDHFCAGTEMFWGYYDRNSFFLCMPDTLAKGAYEECAKLSSAVRKKGLTMTFGIAPYPMLDYNRLDIFLNAKKALAHAGFFEDGAIVLFDSTSLNISADTFYDVDDLDNAIMEFEKAIELDANNTNAMNSLGVCYGRKLDYTQAEEMFNQAISMNAREYIARYNLGLLKLLQDKREEALGLFLQAHSVQGDLLELNIQIGKLYLERGEYQKAHDFLEKALTINPDSDHILRYLADALHGLDKLDEAIIIYKQVLRKNPRNPHCLAALADIFMKKGENPEIPLTFYKESIKLAPEKGDFRYKLGKFYMTQDMTDEAIKEFNKARVLGYKEKQEHE